jgi:hypothetical protein
MLLFLGMEPSGTALRAGIPDRAGATAQQGDERAGEHLTPGEPHAASRRLEVELVLAAEDPADTCAVRVLRYPHVTHIMW